MNVRTRAIFTGKVQGVFFRMNTNQKANELGIKGWVRNVSDGTVEAIFEGEENNIKMLLDWCKTKIQMARVDNLQIENLEYLGEFDSFDVVRTKY